MTIVILRSNYGITDVLFVGTRNQAIKFLTHDGGAFARIQSWKDGKLIQQLYADCCLNGAATIISHMKEW